MPEKLVGQLASFCVYQWRVLFDVGNEATQCVVMDVGCIVGKHIVIIFRDLSIDPKGQTLNHASSTLRLRVFLTIVGRHTCAGR